MLAFFGYRITRPVIVAKLLINLDTTMDISGEPVYHDMMVADPDPALRDQAFST